MIFIAHAIKHQSKENSPLCKIEIVVKCQKIEIIQPSKDRNQN